MKYVKANWNELSLGKKFYFELVGLNHELLYRPVIIIDLSDNKVVYRFEDNWKEYQTKALFREIGLYKEDKQIYLFED